RPAVAVHHLVEDAGERAVARYEPWDVVALPRGAVEVSNHGPSNLSRAAQVEGHGVFERALLGRDVENAAGVAVILEARAAARFPFVGIDRETLVVASARMRDMVNAAAERTRGPGIEDVEGERGVRVDRRLQRIGKLPGLEADARDKFADAAGGSKRQPPSIARDQMAGTIEPGDFPLEPLD